MSPLACKAFESFGVLMAIALLLAAGTRGDPVVGFGETAINGNPTGIGFVDVQITPPTSSGVGYLNVAVDWNNNGLDSGDWLVFNSEIPLQPTEFGGNSATFSSTFDLGSISLSYNHSYTVYASFDPSARSLSDFTGLQTNLGVSFSLYDIGDLRDGIEAGMLAGPGGKSPNFSRSNNDESGLGLNMLAALSSHDGLVRHDTPGIKQKKNECAPTAAAQSLLWLQKRHPDALDGRIPAQDELIQRLKDRMGWTQTGVHPNNFAPGKAQVIKDLNLDRLIISKNGGQSNGMGTFDFIKKELKAGEDVELIIRHPIGAHVVTVVGYFEQGDKRKLFFKDPLTGGDTIDEYELSGTRIRKYKYHKDAFLSFAVSQSVIPEPGTMVLFGIGVLAPVISALRRARKHQ